MRKKGRGIYVNGVGETARKKERMNVYEYEYQSERKGNKQGIKYQWLTNIEATLEAILILICFTKELVG